MSNQRSLFRISGADLVKNRLVFDPEGSCTSFAGIHNITAYIYSRPTVISNDIWLCIDCDTMCQKYVQHIINHRRDVSGMVDSSGVRLYITPEVRKYDAGVIELGLEYTDKMAIPPKQQDFILRGYCIAECTAVVRILHTHLLSNTICAYNAFKQKNIFLLVQLPQVYIGRVIFNGGDFLRINCCLP